MQDRVTVYRVLRRIFGPKREEVSGGLRRLHNEFHNLYTSPNIIIVIKSRMMGCAVHVARKGEVRLAYKIFAGKPEGKRPLVRRRRRWEDNTRMDIREIP